MRASEWTGDVEGMLAMFIPIVVNVALFCFLTVAVWVRERRREREAFYRYEAQKKIVEQSGSGALQVIELMRAEADAKARRSREARTLGGLITTVVGASTGVLLYELIPERGVWAAALIPTSVGLAILLHCWLVSRGAEASSTRRAVDPGPPPPTTMPGC